MRRELSIFFRQLAMAYQAGIPITEGLRTASSACHEPRLREAARDVLERVRGGSPLGPALAAHPEVFSKVESALVTSGEEHGRLDVNLLRLAERSEKQHRDTRRLLLALIYPAGLLVAALFLPKLYVWATRSFAAYCFSVLATALPFLVFLGLLGGGFYLFWKGSPRTIDRVLLLIPVLGPSLRKLALARFAESLAMLYEGGLEIRRSARLAIAAIGNRYLEERCRPLADGLARGGTISEGLAAAGVFPAELVNAVAVGEKTGDLDRALASLARLYQAEAEQAIQAILILLPIGIYLLVALYVAIVVISAFGEYFRLLGSV